MRRALGLPGAPTLHPPIYGCISDDCFLFLLCMQTGKISSGWFKLHQSLQQAGIVSLVASFVVAMTLFSRTNGFGRTLHKLYTPHFGMGVAMTAAALLQAILAAVRPPMMSRYRNV